MIPEVKTRKTFLKGTEKMKSTHCASITTSTLQLRMKKEMYDENSGLNVRIHCLKYGQYFELKEKCLRCRYLISFTQGDK